MTIQHPRKEACSECPFKRESLPGWLGSAESAREFLIPHWDMERPLTCHMEVDWDADEKRQVKMQNKAGCLCRGLLAMMKNVAKRPRDRILAAARDNVPADRETFFSHPGEFFEHHNN